MSKIAVHPGWIRRPSDPPVRRDADRPVMVSGGYLTALEALYAAQERYVAAVRQCDDMAELDEPYEAIETCIANVRNLRPRQAAA